MTNDQLSKPHPAAVALRSTKIGVVANLALAVVKVAAGLFGHCYALIADAVESMADVVSSLIVWGGLTIAAQPPDEDHPYGHGKAEPLAAVAVALALGMAAVGIAVQSIREILTPHHTPAPFTLVVLIAAVAVKEALYRFVIRVGKHLDSTAVKTDAWHHRSDALVSAAAFIGISIAVIKGPGYESADDWAALFASCIIGVNALRLVRPALAEITDAAPDGQIEARIREVASAVPGVVGLDKCLVRKMGFEYYVDLHVEVNGELSVRRGHAIAHNVKDAIRTANPRISEVLVHIEPAPPSRS